MENEESGEKAIPLMRLLTSMIKRMYPNASAPEDLTSAYRAIFDPIQMEEHRAELDVILSSYRPQSLSELEDMVY